MIVVQKLVSNRFYAKALKVLFLLHRKNTLFDLDDAEHIRSDTKSLFFFLKQSAAVCVGSDALKTYCEQFNPNVFILTSPVVDHPHKKTKRNGKLHIGWVGDFGNGKQISVPFSHKTSMYKLFFPELKKLQRPVKFSIIGVKNEPDIQEIRDYFEGCDHIELVIPEGLNWKQDLWVYPEIAKFDVGVAPMVDHPYNHAKSAFKSKQYLSVGVPVVASDVGENVKFVEDRKNGFLIQEEAGFLSALERIAEMEDAEYFAMSAEALESRDGFSTDEYCRAFLKQYQSIS